MIEQNLKNIFLDKLFILRQNHINMKIIVLTIFCLAPWFCFGLKCKQGEEGGPWNRSRIFECREREHFCIAASCIYLNSGFWSQPEVVKAVYNVTKWDCAEDSDLRYAMSAYIADIDMVCDEPRFIGEKDVDLANINYTGVFPTAREYKLAGLEPPTTTPTTTTTTEEEQPPMTTSGKGDELSSTMTATKNGVDSAFINLLLVMLTFVMAILRHF